MTQIKRRDILICRGTGCNSLNAQGVNDELEDLIKKSNLNDFVNIKKTGCHGFCQVGPTLIIKPDNIMYVVQQPKDMKDVVEQHLKRDKIVKKLLYINPANGKFIQNKDDIQFYKAQQRLTTVNCGVIDPEDIDEYISLGGYNMLKKCLVKLTPENVIDEVKKSRLRGRGGAGFPTGLKWSFCANAEGNPKYLICNGDEGDPGAFMDRTILESDPHAVIEGMAIGAYAIGASYGYVYIRAEYPLAIERFTIALNQAKEKGFIGENAKGIFVKLKFDIELQKGAGAFVCGEETALMQSIMGKRGNPMPKPPYPANSGLYGRPTNINNVKTWATIPKILAMGASNYSAIGSEDASGTIIIALTGKINNAGLVEIPMGTTIRKLIFEIGGGIPNNKKFKAIQIGGPSGGCIPAKFLDTPMDYLHLTELGAIMGSGGLIVLDEDTCMVELAHFFIDFTQKESCGKCIPCRVGTRKMLKIIEKIRDGNGTLEDIEILESIANTVKKASLCGLGQTAPNPVLTTLKYFREEYEAHLKGICPAKVCKKLIEYEIVESNCTKCKLCIKNCPVIAIEVENNKFPKINPKICIRCGVCFSNCPTNSIIKISRGIKNE
ncbi:MAG: NADH-ubiquinone oxidoreductase-F iron-sulfur binding region domain-containing protein [Promethearchaeota archaeon]